MSSKHECTRCPKHRDGWHECPVGPFWNAVSKEVCKWCSGLCDVNDLRTYEQQQADIIQVKIKWPNSSRS